MMAIGLAPALLGDTAASATAEVGAGEFEAVLVDQTAGSRDEDEAALARALAGLLGVSAPLARPAPVAGPAGGTAPADKAIQGHIESLTDRLAAFRAGATPGASAADASDSTSAPGQAAGPMAGAADGVPTIEGQRAAPAAEPPEPESLPLATRAALQASAADPTSLGEMFGPQHQAHVSVEHASGPRGEGAPSARSLASPVDAPATTGAPSGDQPGISRSEAAPPKTDSSTVRATDDGRDRSVTSGPAATTARAPDAGGSLDPRASAAAIEASLARHDQASAAGRTASQASVPERTPPGASHTPSRDVAGATADGSLARLAVSRVSSATVSADAGAGAEPARGADPARVTVPGADRTTTHAVRGESADAAPTSGADAARASTSDAARSRAGGTAPVGSAPAGAAAFPTLTTDAARVATADRPAVDASRSSAGADRVSGADAAQATTEAPRATATSRATAAYSARIAVADAATRAPSADAARPTPTTTAVRDPSATATPLASTDVVRTTTRVSTGALDSRARALDAPAPSADAAPRTGGPVIAPAAAFALPTAAALRTTAAAVAPAAVRTGAAVLTTEAAASAAAAVSVLPNTVAPALIAASERSPAEPTRSALEPAPTADATAVTRTVEATSDASLRTLAAAAGRDDASARTLDAAPRVVDPTAPGRASTLGGAPAAEARRDGATTTAPVAELARPVAPVAPAVLASTIGALGATARPAAAPIAPRDPRPSASARVTTDALPVARSTASALEAAVAELDAARPARRDLDDASGLSAPREPLLPTTSAPPRSEAAAGATPMLPVTTPDGHIGHSRAAITVGEGDDRVRVVVHAHGSQVQVDLTAANPALAQAATQDRGQLDRALASHGLQLGDLTASADGRGQQQHQQRTPEAREAPEVTASNSQPNSPHRTAPATPARRMI